MSMIDSIQNANEKFNIEYNKNGYSSKVLTLDDIPNTVELYKTIYELLQQKNCEKFIHPMDKDALEEIISCKDQAILGYFKDKQLLGTLYTKPFEKDSPYFKTPSFDDGTTYALGGLAVNPQFRGQGVITKLSKILHSGVKDFAVSHPEEKIAGLGAEISCENFSSLASAKNLKDENGNTILNFSGIHYISQPQSDDNDLTVLGYNSFTKNPEKIDTLPQAILDGNQQHSFITLNEALQQMEKQSSNASSTLTEVGEHSILTLNSYIEAPYKDILTFDKGPEQ